jgi:RimJ/RimL family protein N-acetyltransferase
MSFPFENITSTITLRLADIDDAAFILSLREDPTLNQHLSPVSGGLDGQKQWLEQYKKREQAGQEYYFILINKEGTPVGTTRIYNIKGDDCEVGSSILTVDAPPSSAIEGTLNCWDIIFSQLKLKTFHCQVTLGNKKAYRFHQHLGSTEINRDEENIYFIVTPEHLARLKKRYARLLK